MKTGREVTSHQKGRNRGADPKIATKWQWRNVGVQAQSGGKERKERGTSITTKNKSIQKKEKEKLRRCGKERNLQPTQVKLIENGRNQGTYGALNLGKTGGEKGEKKNLKPTTEK